MGSAGHRQIINAEIVAMDGGTSMCFSTTRRFERVSQRSSGSVSVSERLAQSGVAACDWRRLSTGEQQRLLKESTARGS